MKITQFFTATGLWGVVLLFVGPVMAGVGYWRLIEGTANSMQSGSYLQSNLLFDAIVIFIGGVLCLSSLPMMIIGREFHGVTTALPGTRLNRN